MIWLLFKCFPGASLVKNPPTNTGNAGSVLGLRRSRGEGNSNPLQYSCLGNPVDRGAWQATTHGVTKSQTPLSNWACIRGQKMWDSTLWALVLGDHLFSWIPLNLSSWASQVVSGKEPTCQCSRHRFSPGLGRSPGRGNGYPLQGSCLLNPMDRGAWLTTVHGITKKKQLSD